MRRMAVVLAAVLVLGGAAFAAIAARTAQTEDTPALVVAHRGASAQAPENTLPAIELAIEQGADLVEIDVQLSADGELILLHDSTLDRTTNVEQVFPDRTADGATPGAFTAAELATLDAGSWGLFAGSRFAGARVPTLDQVLVVLEDHRDVGLLIEIKHPDSSPDIEQRLADQLLLAAERGSENPVIVQSFAEDSLNEFESRQREVSLDHPVALLRPAPMGDGLDQELRAFLDQVNAAQRWLDAETVAALHDSGYEVGAYTVNDPCDMARLTDAAGVDALITDRPDLARTVVDGEADLATC